MIEHDDDVVAYDEYLSDESRAFLKELNGAGDHLKKMIDKLAEEVRNWERRMDQENYVTSTDPVIAYHKYRVAAKRFMTIVGPYVDDVLN